MTEQKIIYVVTDGYYSDYQIKGVFDDETLAEQFRLHFGYHSVEEYVLNLSAPQLRAGLQVYEVRMAHDGTVQYVKRCSDPPNNTVEFWGDDSCMHTEMWAKDEQHAVKIANERRAQVLDNNHWVKHVTDLA